MAAKDELGRRAKSARRATSTGTATTVLDRNWRCAQGEIDLVASHGARAGRGRGEDAPRRRRSGTRSRRSTRASARGSGGSPPRGSRRTPSCSAGRRLRSTRSAIVGADPRPQRSSISRTAHDDRAHLGGRAHRSRGRLVEVEADLLNQTPDFKIIGLPDKALGEAVQRVHNACANCGLRCRGGGSP